MVATTSVASSTSRGSIHFSRHKSASNAVDYRLKTYEFVSKLYVLVRGVWLIVSVRKGARGPQAVNASESQLLPPTSFASRHIASKSPSWISKASLVLFVPQRLPVGAQRATRSSYAPPRIRTLCVTLPRIASVEFLTYSMTTNPIKQRDISSFTSQLWPTHSKLCKRNSPLEYHQPPLKKSEFMHFFFGADPDESGNECWIRSERFRHSTSHADAQQHDVYMIGGAAIGEMDAVKSS